MGTITFERTASTVRIHNPLNGFALEEHRVEVRRDPLTGDTSVLNPYLVAKAGFFGETDSALVARLAEETARNCIFCGESLRTRTARYPDALVPGGRIEIGEATLLPNLFALGAHHPLIVLSRTHFLRPGGFATELLADGLRAAQRFLRLARDRDREAQVAAVAANYLFPAGASLMHPHIQMLVTPLPYSYHARLLAGARRHAARHGSCFFADLVEAERCDGSRFAGRQGAWHWLAAFAPIGANEVNAVHEREWDFAALPDADLEELARGISRVLAFYESLGHLSFNWTLYAAPHGTAGEGFRCLLKIINRQNPAAAYRNDDYFLQKLLQTELIVRPPEELAKRLREVL